MLEIREETTDDVQAIRSLTVNAFANSEFGHNGEAELIDSIRSSAKHVSLVAILNEKIVGHVLFSPAKILINQRETSGLALAPMSVSPDQQRQGIGTTLVKHALNRPADDCAFICVVGHPEYYRRFGFLPAAEFGIEHGFHGLPQDLFFIWCAENCQFDGNSTGRAYFAPEFGPQHIETSQPGEPK